MTSKTRLAAALGLLARGSGALLIAFGLAGCVPDARLKIPLNDVPAVLDDGWLVATPASQGFDAAKLKESYDLFFSEDDFVTARSLLVVRNGYLVAEGYCRDLDDIGRKRAIQSATKSVTSLLVGIAIDQGILDSVGRMLYSIVPDKFGAGADEARRAITLRDLLTMKSGLDFSNDDFTLEMAYDVRGDGTAHILRKPLVHQPGTFYNYQDCDPYLVGAALERLAGASLEEFAVTNLFGKIGISDFIWLKQRDGTTYGAYGLYLTPRNLARLGKLVVQRGLWDGEQVVSSAWIDTSTAKQTDMDPESAGHGFDYGFYWWRVPELGAFTAYGHGGQYVLVAPAKQLVIVMTAEPDTNGDAAEIGLPSFVDLARIVIEAAGP